jgi:hypothetical protein
VWTLLFLLLVISKNILDAKANILPLLTFSINLCKKKIIENQSETVWERKTKSSLIEEKLHWKKLLGFLKWCFKNCNFYNKMKLCLEEGQWKIVRLFNGKIGLVTSLDHFSGIKKYVNIRMTIKKFSIGAGWQGVLNTFTCISVHLLLTTITNAFYHITRTDFALPGQTRQ